MSMNSRVTLVCIAGLVLGACSPALAPPEERDAYMDRVELANVRVSRSVTGRQAVYGDVVNSGDRTLSAVVLTLHFLDEDGETILSRQHTPVSSSLLGGDALEADSSVQFRITVDDAPESWAEKVKVEITELGFES